MGTSCEGTRRPLMPPLPNGHHRGQQRSQGPAGERQYNRHLRPEAGFPRATPAAGKLERRLPLMREGSFGLSEALGRRKRTNFFPENAFPTRPQSDTRTATCSEPGNSKDPVKMNVAPHPPSLCLPLSASLSLPPALRLLQMDEPGGTTWTCFPAGVSPPLRPRSLHTDALTI